MPEFLQWRASEIQHLLWGCCHQTQADTLASGRGWWGPLRGQGVEYSGGGVFKRLCQVGEGSGWEAWPLQDFFPSLRALLRPCLFLLLFPLRHACFHKASLTRDLLYIVGPYYLICEMDSCEHGNISKGPVGSAEPLGSALWWVGSQMRTWTPGSPGG